MFLTSSLNPLMLFTFKCPNFRLFAHLLGTFSSDAFTSPPLGVGGRISVGSSKKESEKLKSCRQFQHVQRGTVRLLLLGPTHFQCTLPRHSLQLSGSTLYLIVLLQARQTFLSLVGTGPGLGLTPQRRNMTGLKLEMYLVNVSLS